MSMYGDNIEVVSRNLSCTVYRITDAPEESCITAYSVFPGIQIMDLMAYGGAGLGIAMSILAVTKWGLSPVAALFLILVAVDFFLPLRALYRICQYQKSDFRIL